MTGAMKFYDTRAERAMAGALAEEHRAVAATQRAEAELRLVEVEAARAELARRHQAEADKRRRAHKKQSRAERAARWATIRTGLTELGRRVAAAVPMLAGGFAMGAPILIGWNGQLDTARTVLHLGLLAWLFPAAIEGGAWWLAYLQHRAIAAGKPTGRLRVWTWLLALLAAGMNAWRGTLAYGPVGGTALGAASLLGIGLWEITAWYLRWSASGRTAGQARQTIARWLRFPRLAFAAWSIATAQGSGAGRDDAWRAAWTDRYGVGPEATRRDRRLARLIVRAEWDADSKAAKGGHLVIVNGIILRPLPQPIVSTLDALAETRETAIEQPKLSRLAAKLLPKVRAAIAAGRLPENPSANKINGVFGGGMETAMEVRDALRSVHPVKREDVA